MRKTAKLIVNPDTGEVLDPKTSPEYYTLDAIRHADVWTPENIRTEYQRLRKIAQGRLAAMAKSEIGRQSRTYQTNKNRFKPVTELSLGQTKIMLAEVSRMIQAKTGTLSGIKAARSQAIKTLQKHGYTFVNEKNYWEFGEFMREWKSSQYRGYGSTVAVDFFESAEKARQNVSGEDFDRATQTVGKQNLIAQEFHDWRMMRNKEYGEGKKKNLDKVTSADLISDWEDWLE